MNAMEEIELFTQLQHTRFAQWLRFKQGKEHANLTNQTDPTVIFRSQGRAQLLGEMLNLCEKAPKVPR